MPTKRISATEAAQRLGVKRETIYAYVSRGMLESHRDIDGKSSTFDPDEVARLRRGRRSSRRGHLDVPITTAITNVHDGTVEYRGVNIDTIVSDGRSFESVASLLWGGSFSGDSEWIIPKTASRNARRVAKALGGQARPVDMMMAALVCAATHDPFRSDTSQGGTASSGANIISTMIAALPAKSDDTSGNTKSAALLWKRLTPASTDNAQLLDLALVLLADHGLATSTLAARLAASTRAGIHAVVLAGLATVVGPLHGGASRLVHEMFADAASRGADPAIAEVLRRHDKVPGIGHLIHRSADPRYKLLVDALAKSSLPTDRADVVQSVVGRITDRYDVAPNIDLALGALTFMAGMSADAGEVIFSVARTAGWVAHGLEEYDELPLRFRAAGRYSGEATASN